MAQNRLPVTKCSREGTTMTVPSHPFRLERTSQQGDLTVVRGDDPTIRGAFNIAKEGWLRLVASYPNLSASDLAVAICLMTYVNSRSRLAWPSILTLAKDTNRDPSTVWRSLQRLEKAKLIEVVHGRGARKSNRYRLTLGDMDIDPRSLRRRTTPRGQTLRTRN